MPLAILRVLAIVCLAAVASLIAASPGIGWPPTYTAQLGVKLERTPGLTEEWTQINATIKDPGKLKAFGFAGAKAGVRVTIRPAGQVDWTTTIEGVRVQPCRIIVTFQDYFRTFKPERETLRLVPVDE